MVSEPLSLRSRQAIFRLVLGNPGIHMREIARRLAIRTSLAEYHLNMLVKKGLLFSMDERGQRTFFVSDNRSVPFDSKQRRILNVLRKEANFRIISFLLERKHAKNSEILSSLPFTPSNLTYHLKRLQKAGIIDKDVSGVKGWSLIDPEGIEILFMRTNLFKPAVSDGFKKIWDEFHI